MRQEHYKRDPNLESLIKEVNGLLASTEQALLKSTELPHPPLFIVGCARSGTTLLYQLLCATGAFAYPSNFISRFYKAPVLASKMQKMLGGQDPNGEVFGGSDLVLESDLGKTKGALAPHEFWYFWRRFFKFSELQQLSSEQIAESDSEQFLKELAGMSAVFDQPLCMKAMILNWHLELLAEIIPTSNFLFIRRSSIRNAVSLLNARQKFFGTDKEWYSFKPAEYSELKHLRPAEQAAAQVYFTNQAIEKGTQHLPRNRVLEISCEALCGDPAGQVSSVLDHFGYVGNTDILPRSLATNNSEIDADRRQLMEATIKRLDQAER